LSNLDHLNYCKEIFEFSSNYQEINFRNVISKSYYFAFYESIARLESLDWEVTNSRGGVHVVEISRFLGYPVEELSENQIKLAKKLHFKMTALKKLRTKVDYKLDQPISKNLAIYSITEAEKISNDLKLLGM